MIHPDIDRPVARPSRRGNLLVRVIAIGVLVVVLGRQSFAQPAASSSATVDTESAIGDTSSVTESRDGAAPLDLSRSLTFARNRELDPVVRDAHASIQREDWTRTSELLLELFTASAPGFVEVNDVLRSPQAEAARLLETLPPAGRAAYARMAEARGAESLSAAYTASSFAQLVRVADQFRGTPSGTRAGELAIAILRDQGQAEDLPLLTPSLGREPIPSAIGSDQHSSQAELPALADGGFPSHFPVWTITDGISDPMQSFVSELIDRAREDGRMLAPTRSAAISDDVLLTATPVSRKAVVLATGELLWEQEMAGSAATWLRVKEIPHLDTTRLEATAQLLTHQLFANTSGTSLSVQGDRAFFNEPLREDFQVGLAAVPQLLDGFPARRVLCAEVRTGKVFWTLEDIAGEPACFFGAPTVINGRLLVLGEVAGSNSLTLFSLNKDTGEPVTALPLGQPLLPIQQDLARSMRASQLNLQQGRLLCLTGSGAIVAVDLLQGNVLWAYRYPRSDLSDYRIERDRRSGQPPVLGSPTFRSRFLLQASEGLLAFSTPESSELHLLHAASGERLRSLPLADGSQVHAITPNLEALVLSVQRAQLIDLKTEEVLWSVSTPAVAGFGVLAGEKYICPVQEQGTIAIDLRDGSIEQSSAVEIKVPRQAGSLLNDVALRNLVSVDGHLIEAGVNETRLLQSPSEAAKQPQGESRLPRALTRAEQGDVSGAVELLDPSRVQLTDDERDLRFRLLLSAYQNEHLPLNHLTEQIEEIIDSSEERALWRQRQADRALAEGHINEFVEVWLTTPEEIAAISVCSLQGTGRCRLDRWFQAAALAWCVELNSPERRTRLDDALARFIDSSSDATSEQKTQLISRLGPTPWGDRERIRWTPRPGDWRETLRSLLPLMRIAQGQDSELAAGATIRLIEILESCEQHVEADRWWTHLSKLPPETPFPDGRRVSEVLLEEREKRGMVAGTSIRNLKLKQVSAWPSGLPSVVEKSRSAADIYFNRLPIQAPKNSLFSSLAVELEWPNYRKLRFNGSRWNETWTLSFPASRQGLRPTVELNRGWGLGPLFVLQSGSDLFGIVPFTRKGERSARLLWPPQGTLIDTLGYRSGSAMFMVSRPLPERPGFHGLTSDHRLESGAPAAAVGPVLPEGVGFWQRGSYVWLDAATGDELWRTVDLPKGSYCIGEGTEIAAIAGDLVTVVSTIDGSTLESFRWDHDREDIVAVVGVDVIVARGDPRKYSTEAESLNATPESARSPMQLERVDVRRNESEWQRAWPAGSIPFELDDHWIGVLLPSRDFEFVDLKSGETVVTHQLPLGKPIELIACSVAEQDLIVAFSHHVEDSRLTIAPQLQRGFRRPFVSGPMIGFDRETGEWKWMNQLEDTVFPCDQPPDLPLLVTAEARYPPQAESRGRSVEHLVFGSRIRCYDRRTGTLVAELNSPSSRDLNYSIVGDRRSREIHLRTRTTRIEFDFSSTIDDPRQSQGATSRPASEPITEASAEADSTPGTDDSSLDEWSPSVQPGSAADQ